MSKRHLFRALVDRILEQLSKVIVLQMKNISDLSIAHFLA